MAEQVQSLTKALVNQIASSTQFSLSFPFRKLGLGSLGLENYNMNLSVPNLFLWLGGASSVLHLFR